MPEKHLARKYKVVKLINHGPYAKVYHARDTSTGQSVAIKAIDNQEAINKKTSLAELEAMTRLSHRNVISLVEVFEAESQLYIVTEFAKCGDLFEVVASRGRLGEDMSRHFFRQLISAVKHCHSNGVYHRDIKPENLLLDEKWALKLSDFGLCKVTDEATKLWESCGTTEYAAPEVLEGRGYYGAPADVWSCGVVLYVLTAGFLPFEADGEVGELWRKMKKGEFKLPKWLSPGLKWLLLRILDPNPDTRATIDEILEDGWLNNGFNDQEDIDLGVG